MLAGNPLLRRIRTQFRRWRRERYAYKRLVEVRIHQSCLLHNLRQFQAACAPRRIAPVLKSNAYGHGLAHVARVLDRSEIAFLVVDGYYEALILRNEGIRSPILVIGYSATENIVASRLKDVAFTVFDVAQLRELAQRLRKRQAIHLKIDTGMRRHGVLPREVREALEVIRGCSNLVFEGLCSHLADANGRNASFTMGQIRTWNEVVASVRKEFPEVIHRHLANTAGSYYSDHFDANVVRLGIGLYGLDFQARRSLDLAPALEVASRVGTVKSVAEGDYVGYGKQYQASHASLMVTVPTGYGACVDIRLSNRGAFTIRGKSCPIIGRISMNSTSVDASALLDVQCGEEVEIISARPEAMNSVANIARLCDTSPYVILAGIAPHLRRVVVDDPR